MNNPEIPVLAFFQDGRQEIGLRFLQLCYMLY